MIYPDAQKMRIGIVMRRSPGVTAWAKWVWKAVAALPGAPDADWKLLREADGVTEYHAATRDVWLYVSDTEAYVHELGAREPSIYVVLREGAGQRLEVVSVTLSPYEAQDYGDSGEEIVEKLPMPPAVAAWVQDFVATHHVEETFVKRRRDKKRVDLKDDGKGDERIAQASDVFRAPRRRLREQTE